MPHCHSLLRVPIPEFYQSYRYFVENSQGRRELAYFLDKLKPGDILYDIGAFHGVFSAAAKIKLQGDVSVHAFEPLQENARVIEKVLRLNAFENFRINPVAVGDGGGISGVIHDNGFAMLRPADKDLAAKPIPATSLDGFIALGNSAPTVIKMDVEGFEFKVLAGARRCLEQSQPRLWIEVHPQFLAAQGIGDGAVLDLLGECGYRISVFQDFDSPHSSVSYHIWCERGSGKGPAG